MKFSVRILSALLLVMAVCTCASAALPSVTMLSTKTCPACAQMEKVMKEIDAKYSGQISTEHIYLEDKPELAKKYNIRYVPTLLFKDSSGKIVAQEIGYKSLDAVLEVFRKAGITL
ncbi:MAG: thioredoxin family protein [Synergistaceae bacterium]|nr:thioredoxin family protein [Synergistaceae bacterium]